MTKKYQTKSDLNRNDLEIIEQTLREQAGRFCLTKLGEQASTDNVAQLKSRTSSILSVLVKLYNQPNLFCAEKTCAFRLCVLSELAQLFSKPNPAAPQQHCHRAVQT